MGRWLRTQQHYYEKDPTVGKGGALGGVWGSYEVIGRGYGAVWGHGGVLGS